MNSVVGLFSLFFFSVADFISPWKEKQFFPLAVEKQHASMVCTFKAG